jgi:uncharacterized membrane protein
MSSHNDEIERIKRLRERQLKLRDPKAKDRQIQHKIASRYHKEKLTFRDVLRDIPGKWMGMILGAIVGIILAIALNLLVVSDIFWIEYVGYFIVLVCIVMGRALGAAMDWRDEDHDALVKRR